MRGEWLTQYTEEFANESEAQEAFDFLLGQADSHGGRLLPPCSTRAGWLVQTFHDAPDCIGGPGLWLPDGMRVVFVPLSLYHRLGLRF